MSARVAVASLADLQRDGMAVAKAGSHAVCVVWVDGRALAVDDRCPHMGFPLHRGTVRDGILTCHWHHARFDLCSGCTLDPWADDVRAYPVEVADGTVYVRLEEEPDRRAHHTERLREGLEQGLTLVTAKAVLGLLGSGVGSTDIVREGVRFGTAYRDAGWGSGLTVLTAMANLLPHLHEADRPLALVHGLAFVSRDTRGHPPRFPLTPLATTELPADRLATWYRRFVETRTADAAERTLLTAHAAHGVDAAAEMMLAAVTDHVFIDEGHTLDFTLKALEAVHHLGAGEAASVLSSLVGQTVRARRHEEEGEWRHPVDLAEIIADAEARLHLGDGDFTDSDVAALGRDLLADDAALVADALVAAGAGGAAPEQLGRALAFAAALRIVHFHTQNDQGDWDVVHHGFTFANALHQALVRHPSRELLRGVLHGAMKVWLDRFLNIPPARPPAPVSAGLDDLAACWDAQGQVDGAGSIVYSHVAGGGDPAAAIAALGAALLREDAGFHWYQTVEAAVRQSQAWPPGSEESALILAGAARFLAAHTPTRRELPQVVRIATRLRRGEDLYEEAPAVP